MSEAKKPMQLVLETLKRSVARGWRQGKFGSVGRRGQASCDGNSASMTGLDLSTINPNGYSTMANGAWAWHAVPNHWFERWVPKPRKGETPTAWAHRLDVLGMRVTAINEQFAYLDWADKESPMENPGENPRVTPE